MLVDCGIGIGRCLIAPLAKRSCHMGCVMTVMTVTILGLSRPKWWALHQPLGHQCATEWVVLGAQGGHRVALRVLGVVQG